MRGFQVSPLRGVWRILSLLALFALSACGHDETPSPPPPAPVVSPSLIPWPASVVLLPGGFTVRDGMRIVTDPHDPAATETAHYLADHVKRVRGLTLVPQSDDISGKLSGAIVLKRLPGGTGLHPEGYKLDVESENVVVSASDDAGLFYGAVTLWQLLTQQTDAAKEIPLPAMHIEDAPRFRWRGLLLDSARHYQSPDYIRAFLDQMALHKLNVLQWHLTDDQAWRLEIKRYPRLTRVGAWRVPAGRAAANDIDPKTGKPRLYGGLYTQAEARALVRYAAERHITIVPEIEMPGHATAAIAAYPKLGSIANPPTMPSSDWGVFPNLYNVDDPTFQFLEHVLAEVMQVFPSSYIHVGGDEAVKDQWKASPRIQAQMRRLHIANEDALQSYFIARIGTYLKAHGRTLIGWDEILDGGVPANATITSWRGIDGAIAAARLGHDAVLSPAPDLYFDNRQGSGPDEPPGRGFVLSLERVYAFDAMPPSLTDAQRAHIIGVQANIWTEHIRTENRVDDMTFPRAAALAEVAWSAPHDWRNFLLRLVPQMKRYAVLGVSAAQAAFRVEADAAPRAESGEATIALSDQSRLGAIRYILGGGAPGIASPVYGGTLDVALPQDLRAGVFLENAEIGPPADFPLSPLSVRHRFSQQLDLCSHAIDLSVEDDAPLNGPRAVFLADIMNPCWIYRHADMDGIGSLSAGVGQIPFNFQIGHDIDKVTLRPPRTPSGELEVHRDSCNGPIIADLPLAPALTNDAITSLSAPVAPLSGAHDLCFVFTQKAVDPLWLLDWVQLVPQVQQ